MTIWHQTARCRGDDRDRGVTTIFVAMFAVVVLLMVGLVYEGGRFLEAKRAARHAAVGAARAGAQELDENAIRFEDASFNALDPGAAHQRACDYLNNAVDEKHDVSCSDASINPEADGITVQVTIEVDMHLLPQDWLSREVTAEGHACAEAGISSSQGLCD